MFREVPTHKLAAEDRASEVGTRVGVGGWQHVCSANEDFKTTLSSWKL